MSVEVDYLFPFDRSTNPLRISQGRNGPWSHYLIRREIPEYPGRFFEMDLSNAVDFALPLGSKVRTARSGIVSGVWLKSDIFYEGLDPEIGNNLPAMSTNFIVITHEDKTMSIYSHLGKEELVKNDQEVDAGEIIGLTGKSGWIAQVPHLHFQVNDPMRRCSLPVDFKDYNGSLDHKTLAEKDRIWWG